MNAHGNVSSPVTANIGTASKTAPLRGGEASIDIAERPALAAAKGYTPLYVTYVVVLLSAVNTLNYMDRMALSVLIPFIKADLQLSDGQLGLLVGFAFFLFYATCGIPIAIWADRGVRRNIVALSITVWCVMTALSGVAQNFWQLFAARVGLGAGEAGCVPASQSIIADYVPLVRRSAVFGVYGLGSVIGTMLGLALAGTLAQAIGWRWTFVALGLPGILLAVLVRLTLCEPTRGHSDVYVSDARIVPLRQTLGTLWRCRTYRQLTIYYVANGFIYAGLMQWYPSFYTRIFGISSGSVGLYLGVSTAVGAALGLVIGGLLANKAARRDVRLPFAISTVTALTSLPTALGVVLVPSWHVSMLLASITALLWHIPSGAVAAALYSVVRPTMRATAGAIAIFCISVLGFGLGPLCVGVLSDLLSPRFGVEALRYALMLPVCFVPVVALALYSVTAKVREDLREAGASA